MVLEFKLPEMGENIESAEITKVLVKAGDSIAVDQSIIEIETDKATVEVPSEIDLPANRPLGVAPITLPK